MELKWAHYALAFNPNGWGVDVTCLMDVFGADPGKLLVMPGLPVHLGVRVHAQFGTKPGGHILQATIKDHSGNPISNTQSAPVNFIALPPAYPLVGLAQVPINGWTPLPSVGRYSVDLAVDGSPIGHVPLVIIRRQGRVTPSQGTGAAGLQLGWAHYLAGGYMADHKLPGLHLGGIFDLLPSDPQRRAYNLNGSMLLLQIVSDLTIHTQRELRADLVDARFGGAPIASITQPINLRRASPAWDFLVSTAPVRFEHDLWLPPGQYNFLFSVDGQPLGQPLQVTVIG